MKKVIFISGHLDLTQEEFDLYYKDRIKAVFEEGSTFIVGDAPGADFMAQTYLRSLKCSNVVVYHIGHSPRNSYPEFWLFGGFISDLERDSSMTRASNEDIAWVRPGRENSGTAKNLRRRYILNG